MYIYIYIHIYVCGRLICLNSFQTGKTSPARFKRQILSLFNASPKFLLADCLTDKPSRRQLRWCLIVSI